jgi:GSH-dependent disulfide-bond oxidoreductase
VIEVYGGPTPNVVKVLIALEELGIQYRRVPVDITKGEQFTPEFLAISPNNRVPAIVDLDPLDGKGPLSVFESGAILVYLSERDSQHRLMPSDLRNRSAAMEWLMWQMAGQGPMLGQAGHFRNYAPEKVPYGIIRYTKESARLYGVLDKRLEGREWIAETIPLPISPAGPGYFSVNSMASTLRIIRTSPAGMRHSMPDLPSSVRLVPIRRRSR